MFSQLNEIKCNLLSSKDSNQNEAMKSMQCSDPSLGQSRHPGGAPYFSLTNLLFCEAAQVKNEFLDNSMSLSQNLKHEFTSLKGSNNPSAENLDKKWNMNLNKYILDNADEPKASDVPNMNRSADFVQRANHFELPSLMVSRNLRASTDFGIIGINNSLGGDTKQLFPSLFKKAPCQDANFSKSQQL